MSGNITETLRNLETQWREKEIILHYFHKDSIATKEVLRIANNENVSLKANKEIAYYEKILGFY